MREEMVRRKAIPEGRDRAQSQVLVWTMGTILVWLGAQTAAFALHLAKQFPAFVLGTVGITVAFAAVAFGLRAATLAGAVLGGIVCFQLTFWLGHYADSLLRTGLTPLVLLFVLTFGATRMGKRRKLKAGLAEGRRGRSAAQVVANLCVAGAASSWLGATVLLFVRSAGHPFGAMGVLIGTVVLAALSEATADTVSSEIGQAFGGRPVMLTTMRRVEAGVDGAVSMVGTAAGIAAAAIVILAGQWALRLGIEYAVIAFVSGVAGLFFDSLLGATVERRGWLGNDLVNFTSTLFAAVTSVGLVIALD